MTVLEVTQLPLAETPPPDRWVRMDDQSVPPPDIAANLTRAWTARRAEGIEPRYVERVIPGCVDSEVYRPEWDAAPPLGLDDAPAFVPLTDDEAASLARRLAHYQNEIAAVKANADAIAKELEGKRDWLLQAEDQRIREWIARGKPGAKSRRTLFGLLGTRQSGGGVAVADLAKALEWTRECWPDAIRESVDVKLLSFPETLDPETGEMRPTVPDGFEWKAPVSRLYVQSLPRGGKDEA